jgi:subtilase family serine protease
MRRSRSALLSLSNLLTSNFSTLILCILIFSTVSFAAAPDRITGPIVSGQLIKLSAGVPMKARSQYDQGPADPSIELSYMTLLTVPSASQQRAITRLLAQQQDPRSSLYHKWLTPEQYADRFGLSPNDIQKITTWLQSKGFSILEVARARNFIVFSGTAAQAESAFQTQIHNFKVNGEMHFSNTTPPMIPAALSTTSARNPRPSAASRPTRLPTKGAIISSWLRAT